MCLPSQRGHVIETALRCDQCAYNLTGLIEPRCPECGQRFDFSSNRPTGIRLEHLLLLLNVLAILLAVVLTILLTSAPPQAPEAVADEFFAVALLVPLQWVLGLGGSMVGMQVLHRCSRSGLVVAGTFAPWAAALAPLVSLL